MGLVYADIELSRGADFVLVQEGYLDENQVRKVYVRAMVDSGATMLAVPEYFKKQLDLRLVREIEAELADGSSSTFEVVAPVGVRFENRNVLVEALVVLNSTQVLLGAIPMKGMDVLIDPKREQLIINPESPDVARMLLM